MKDNRKYNIYDEYGRLIESNVGLKRAQNTQKLNPGSQIKTSGNAGKGGKNEYYNQDRKNYRPG
jgi:hypothetical protein